MTISKPINQIELHVLTKHAEAKFIAKKMRFTPLREQVFRIIARNQAHIGAYAIIAKVSEQSGRKSPITIYRALDALTVAGAIGRIGSKSAYFVSRQISETHAEPHAQPVVLCCNSCGRVADVAGDDVIEAVRKLSAAAGFEIDPALVEACGLCRSCAQAARAAARPEPKLAVKACAS